MGKITNQRVSRFVRRGTSWVFALALSFVFPSANAQLPTPLPQPNVNLLTSGDVYAIARLADGSVLIGGRFVSVNGVLRSNIAKRLPDGTLDPNWHPAIDGDVRALAVDGNGNVYAGGEFSHVDGYARRNLVKISPTGTVVPGWDPSPDGMVQAILVNAAGEAFVGGWFDNIGGQARSKLAKVAVSSGIVAPQWNPSPAAATAILALRLSHDGKLYAGGQYSGIGGLQRKNIAKVSMSGPGAVDPDWDPSPNTTVTDIAVAPDGSVFITGEFWEFRTPTNQYWFRNNLAKLSGTGSGLIIGEWDPFNFEQGRLSRHVAVDENGWVYVSGGQSYLTFPDGSSSEVIRVSASGAGQIDAPWNPRVAGSAYVLLADGDKLFVGGSVNEAAGQMRLGFVALDANANAGPVFDAEAPGNVAFAMATQSDGRLIISGKFAKANGQLRGGLLRLNTDGSLDADWNPSPNGVVRAIAFATDGSAILGGNFSQIGGQRLNAIAKLSSVDGSADPSWKPELAGYVRTITSDNAGLIYAAGAFNHGSGSAYQRNLVRIDENGIGEVDTTWRPDPNGEVQELSLDGHGALFLRGQFLAVNGEPRKRIAKLLTTGPTVVDLLWNPRPLVQMYQIVADGLGSLFVAGGAFPITGGGSTAAIAKLSTSGVGDADPLWKPFSGRVARHIAIDAQSNSLFADSSTYDATTGIDTYYLSKHSTNGTGEADPAWSPTVNSAVTSIRVNAGKVLLGGYFTEVSGQQRYGLAALPLSVPDVIHMNGFDSVP